MRNTFLYHICLFFIPCTISLNSIAQDMTVFASNMRSRTPNTLYDDEFRIIGVYKVKGNSYLLKGNNVSDIYTSEGYGVNIPLVFDTYTHELSVMLPDKKKIVQLITSEVDSFYLKIDYDKKLTGPIMFRNMHKVDSTVNPYMQVLVKEGKYGLFKSYHAELVNAASDIAQTKLKEFEIRSTYYFLNNSEEKKSLIKITNKAKNLKTLFKDNVDGLIVLNNPSNSYENNLINFVEWLNTQ